MMRVRSPIIVYIYQMREMQPIDAFLISLAGITENSLPTIRAGKIRSRKFVPEKISSGKIRARKIRSRGHYVITAPGANFPSFRLEGKLTTGVFLKPFLSFEKKVF